MLRSEGAPDGRPHPQDVEELRRDALRHERLWLDARFTQREPAAGDRRDRLEHALLGRPVHVVLRRHEPERGRLARIAPGATARSAALTDGDEPIVLVEWQGAKNDGVHDRKDGGRRADAQRQDDEGGERDVLG